MLTFKKITLKVIQILLVILAKGLHLFPFRTEKLRPLAPMVLPYNEVGESVIASFYLLKKAPVISEAFFVSVNPNPFEISKNVFLDGFVRLTGKKSYFQASRKSSPPTWKFLQTHPEFCPFCGTKFLPQNSSLYPSSLLCFVKKSPFTFFAAGIFNSYPPFGIFSNFLTLKVSSIGNSIAQVWLVILGILFILRGLLLGIPYLSPILDSVLRVSCCCH